MGDDDEKMGDASLPPLTFGAAGASGDWAADVEHEHEASGRNADVLELEREKARKRAERFGQAFKEPSKKTLAGAHGLLSRKEVLAVRKEHAMKKAARGGQFVTGIDLFDPEEEAKRAARAAKFGAMLDAAPEQAAFAFGPAAALRAELDRFAIGSPDYPDRSTTLVALLDAFAGAEAELTGPGIRGTARLALGPARADVLALAAPNAALFPQGRDLFLAAEGRLAALPRTTRLREV